MNGLCRSWRRVSLCLASLCAAMVVSVGRANPQPAPVAPPATATAPAVSIAALNRARLHEQIVKNYVESAWETLPADLARTREITAMTRDQQSDINYIRKAFAECRPAWWEPVKQGRAVMIQPTVWQRTFPATWDPSLRGSFQLNANNNQVSMVVQWPAADMDSADLLRLGFTRGDNASFALWSTLEGAAIWLSTNVQRLNALTPTERSYLDRFVAFRGAATAVYYGTPKARRWAMVLCLQSLADNSSGAVPRKPVGAMLVAEFIGKPDRYPTLQMSKVLTLENTETLLAASLASAISQEVLTFAEDRALREAVREFAAANALSVFDTGKVVLANKQIITLDPGQDRDSSSARNKWLVDEQAKPAPATRPAATQP